MAYGSMSLEKRIKENIKSYSLSGLFDLEKVEALLKMESGFTGLEILLTERHGEEAVCIGDFDGFEPDVVAEPGRKIRVAGRTVGHVYVKKAADATAAESNLLEPVLSLLEELGEQTYLRKETALYTDALEEKMGREGYHRTRHGECRDELTGVLNKSYFEERMKVMDRAELIPVAVLEVNINDWKFANDHFGDEESDRLIRIVADILSREATSEYVIGRVDGDVFHVLIPMPEDGEAEAYIERIVGACNGYEDARLAPSIAVGMVMKTNVEETLSSLFADAEYEMFQNKLDVKQGAGYQERLQKAL